MKRPPWPAGRGHEHERFARAVDERTGRDPEFGDELAVVDALRRLGATAAVDEESRERIAHRVATTPEPARRRRRRAPVLAAAIAVLIALGGLTTLLSGDALPGEPLYDLKRAREAAVLQLTFDDEARALRHLEYAARRLDELTILAGREPAGGPGHTVALEDFTGEARAGTAQLTALATGSDGHHLGTLRSWATARTGELTALRPVLAAATAEPAALLVRIEERAAALAERMGCYQITSGDSDDLGALPARGDCRPNRGGPAGGVPTLPGPFTGDPGTGVREPLAVAPPPPSSATPAPRTAAGAGPTSPRPPPPTTTTTPPPIVEAPIPSTVPGPRLPDSGLPRDPVVSIPLPLPGLPELGLG
ncbi:DUF5667 domain-containing protein [Qaidamihabitans albus]|uniref:DUF5667 domain-containing protein n=1 Tax=Qaidamihabitans albus TaxID=2795733 RepID=UPI0018F1C357|nr:DUF5667 domain-containing protein [Qaidamihabitans albus]